MGADTGPLSTSDPGGASDLRALATGHWSAWAGLPSRLSTVAVTEQLGEPLDPAPHGGVFGGAPAMLRRWPPSPGAPRGLTVWFEGDVAVGVQVEGAARAQEDGALPEPDLDEESGLGATVHQLVWATRGLVLHTRGGGEAREAALLLGLAPLTVAAWERDPLRHWGAERRRR